VLVQGVWDLAANGTQTPATLLWRTAIVAASLPACFGAGERWTPLRRTALLYLMLGGALVVSASSLATGLRAAMPGMFLMMLVAGLLESRPRRCMAILCAPSLLYGALGAVAFPLGVWMAALTAGAVMLALTLALCAANGELRRRAWQHEQQLLHACRHDSLTGALARAYVVELAQHQLALALRYRRPFAVAMLDIDHFKAVNDTHGHAMGDVVLRALVRSGAATLRASDRFGRLGGEEFVLLMPETGAADALACAERIRADFAALRFPSAQGMFSVTLSVGVCVLDEQRDWDTMLHDADRALYQAKEAGRNRIVLARTARR
jgi:diguanylate cyclase (GGDEF)-like protein